MPTYELKCNECGNVFDLFLLRILTDGDKVCPECGSRDVRQGVGGGILGSGVRQSASSSCGSTGFA